MSVTESMTRLQAQREALVEAALEHVPFDGWTKQALHAGAEDLDLAPGEVDRLLPNGIRQAIVTYVEMTDRKMIAALDEKGLENLKIRDRIATAVKTRLELVEGQKDTVRAALAFMTLPQNAALGLKLTHGTVDAMWVAAGDTSTDHNWYTKRMLLAGVYGSTLAYWLDDTSEGHADSWAFLDRRIGNVMQIPKITAKIGKAGKFAAAPFKMGAKIARCMPTPGRMRRQFGG
ncbi:MULTISPECIES: COQ9 family protein [Thalassospira]|jgi:ubiquinone biosynthesis protein COQ9|uniref:Ubiquinone biosynthesis protein n=3 Tax=Thalassospira TaxID=168934 RepID=A0A853L2R8_9PROT|nr:MULTISPECIES: COQ9 family protein [Thalassospira]KXJ54262.1 MAG: ubiquinone biosynthesis protein [Thalassospira sp. Nap_22]KZC99439.1 ubiquinone biosynthesis protein [Thalassospira sp. MCCC 1A02898]MBO6816810.1 COQ9 family protein [Thalassospira sp.]MBO6890093.1 COQ9 family protein [Thalassospira sp.]NJB74328.1 ubiquinone biosynthesis protein COQ9 [Thalassospira tepidiphila]